MTPAISEKWGKKAHEVTNQFRASEGASITGNDVGLEEFVWSNQLHSIAYQRCDEVAKGIIPYGQSNFMNLLTQMRTYFEPKYEVASLAEQITKIVDAGQMEDYINDWRVNWTVDH